MFSVLYETVFPALGRFFGTLAGVASSPFMTSISFLLPQAGEHVVIDCLNVFTGEAFTLEAMNRIWGIPVFGQIVTFGMDVVRGICYYSSQFLGVTNVPFVFGLLVLFGAFFFGFVFFRWVRKFLFDK